MMHNNYRFPYLSVLFVLLISGVLQLNVQAQWTNHYQKLDDFGHHVYLEQHELPILAHGVTDPAPAPDGKQLAFASQGWIWLLNLETGVAEQLTDGPGVDSRPRWSPDGNQLAFVRDSGDNTAVVIRELSSGDEHIIDTPAIELDPEFSADGTYLYYTTGVSGSLELHRRHLQATTEDTLTLLRQVVRNVRPLPDRNSIVYLHGVGAHRVIRERNFITGTDEIIHSETLTYHLTADTHPKEQLIVYSAPIDNDYHLWTMDVDDPRVKHRITNGSPYATTPAFSADGDHIYYVDLDENRQFNLMRIPTYGGTPVTVAINQWKYKTDTGRLSLTIENEKKELATARISIKRADGHPVAYAGDATYFDPQTGRYYFYVEGNEMLNLPEGRYTLLAARGPMSQVFERDIRIRSGQTTDQSISLTTVWDASAAGYISADHHVHLNGDGHHRARHDHALRNMAGESLDQLAPMSWNRWERRIDQHIVGKESSEDGYTVQQGQEVRSHFHGHIGLLNVNTPFAPWFFGPYNPTLGDPDLTNGDVIAYADKHGAFPTYVHPISTDQDPLGNQEVGYIPLELVSDGVLSERMGIELVCAWTSPLGNAALWYRFLNIGKPVAAMSGTDGWIDFHRTPAVGTGRNYVRMEGEEPSVHNVVEAAAAGKSFLTTGPALLFEVGDGKRPGDVVASGTKDWTLTLASTNDIDVVEIIVNGEVAVQLEGIKAGDSKEYTGQIELPNGGWVSARAYAGEQKSDQWPTMHVRPFAHTSPVWIGEIGSTDPQSRSMAANDLIRAINAAEISARNAYGEVETPRLHARFDEARDLLRDMLEY